MTLQEKVFEKLFKAAEIAKFNRTELAQYEQSLKYYRDLKNVIDTSFGEGESKGHAEGRIEGRVEGHAEGRIEGRAEGHAEGLTEAQKRIARNALRDNIPPSAIAKFTDLSEEEIAALQTE